MHPNQSEPQNQILQTLLKSKITIVLRNKKIFINLGHNIKKKNKEKGERCRKKKYERMTKKKDDKRVKMIKKKGGRVREGTSNLGRVHIFLNSKRCRAGS